MRLSLSTRWNAASHGSGETLVDEILALGFTRIELGYDLTFDQAAGVKKKVDEKAVTVESVHSFCPVPLGVPGGHPELFLLASVNARIREQAVLYTARTVEFAADMGARVVVTHAGRVAMRDMTRKLIAMCERGKQDTPRYQRVLMRTMDRREKKAPRHLDELCRSIDTLLPVLQQNRVCLAMENLPSWDAMPNEAEMQALLARYRGPEIACWHDMGHGQVRENLGLTCHQRWIELLRDRIAGFHMHDVIPPAHDHLMPPAGMIPFAAFREVLPPDPLVVFEPAPGTPPELIFDGVAAIREAWG